MSNKTIKLQQVPLELFNIDKSYSVFSESDYQTAKHSHYAIEIVSCTEGSFSITTNLSTYRNIKSVIIPPSLPHSFSCINAKCNLLFFDPLSSIGKYFMQQYDLASRGNIIVNPSELDQFHIKEKFGISPVLNSIETNFTTDLDFRIISCIQTINSLVADDNVTLTKLSRASFLSESRLSHLFKNQLGISVHQYILWKKTLLAVSKSREGYSLTECAHYAGFSDSSHFNKVFYKMFGVNPFFVLKS